MQRKTKDEPPVMRPPRCVLYSATAPMGNIFVGTDTIEAAIEKGWVDTPPEQFAEETSAFDTNDSDLGLRLEDSILDLEEARNEIHRLDAALTDANDRASEAEASAMASAKRAETAEKRLEKAVRKTADAC